MYRHVEVALSPPSEAIYDLCLRVAVVRFHQAPQRYLLIFADWPISNKLENCLSDLPCGIREKLETERLIKKL